MADNKQQILTELARSIDRPTLADPRLDFSPDPRYYPQIATQARLTDASSWPWSATTKAFSRVAKIPLKLRESNVQVAICSVCWLASVSEEARRSGLPIQRRSPLFLADAVIDTDDTGSNPQIIRLAKPPTVNFSLLFWMRSHSIDVNIDPDAPIMTAFRTADERLRPVISDQVHVGIFLSPNAHLARSVDPDHNPEILTSRGVALLIGESVTDLPARSVDPQPIAELQTDPEQENAVHAALRGENVILIGPPGCGKTQTIAAIIISVVRQFPDLKIGVASPVEAAIDALSRYTQGSKAEYQKIRLGKDHDAIWLNMGSWPHRVRRN